MKRISAICLTAFLLMASFAWGLGNSPIGQGPASVITGWSSDGTTTSTTQDSSITGNQTILADSTSVHTFTSANWNEDASTWTMAASGPLVHVTGNTTAVTATMTEAIVVGTTYKVTMAGTGGGATATYTLGGVTGTTIAASGTIAIADYITARTTGVLIITPASTCTVSLSSILVQKLTDNTGDLTVSGNIRLNSPLKDGLGRDMSSISADTMGFGYSALYSNTGANSSGLGHYALSSNTGAYSNGFGYAALQYNTGANSSGLGYQTLRYNTGASSSGLGYQALYSNTGANSSGFGNSALYSNTGVDSSGFGYSALSSNTGANSSGLGNYALYSNTGANSSGLGYAALQYNTGASSSGLGYQALRYNQKDNNTSLGYLSYGNFLNNTGGDKTFAFGDIDIATDRITVNTHGFGATNAYVNLKYTQGTEAIGGLTTATVYQVKIIDANTLGFYEGSRGVNITSTGAGTGHTLTPQYAYTNTTALGANSVPTMDNQVVLGTASTVDNRMWGDLSLGNPTFTTGAAHNAIVLANGTLPTAITNAAGIYAKDSGGTTELFSFDEAGNETQQTAHAGDAPEWMYDAEDGVPMIVKETQHYLGYVRYTNTTRQAKMAGMLDEEKKALAPEKRMCVFKESFVEHETRTGARLAKQDWNANQDIVKAQKDKERQLQIDMKASFAKEVDALEAAIASTEDMVEKESKENEVTEKIQLAEKIVVPAVYEKKPVPARLIEVAK